MDPVALDAILHQCRTQQDALAVYMERCPELTRAEAMAGLWKAIESSGWALLVAPELWAVYQEWLSIARLEGYIERLDHGADLLAAAIDKPETLLLIEMESTKAKLGDNDQVYRTIKTGPDVLSVRTKALSDVSGALGKLEAELARARARFVRASYAYQDALGNIAAMSPQEQAQAILRRAIRDGELAIATAAMDLLKTITGAKDADGTAALAALANHPAVLAHRAQG